MTISPSDRADILDLISEYAYRYDEDRIRDFIELFLDDAELAFYVAGSDEPTLTTTSNAERLSVMQEVRSGPLNQPGQPRHVQTNTVLKRISATTISGRTMLTCTQQPYDGSECRLLFSGIYEDVFERADGRWRFAVRRGKLDLHTLELGEQADT